MSWVAVAVGGGTALGTGLASAFGGGGDSDVRQIPLETPEQTEARKGLLDFAKTGVYGNYTAGSPYTGSLGDFALSSLEQRGLNLADQRLGTAGTGGNLALSDSVISDLLGTDKYNPLAPGGAYDALAGGIDRATAQATAGAKRAAAFGGSLYSTDTIRNLGDVAAQGANTKATTMANLYQNYINSKLGATTTAYNNAATGDALQRGALSDAFTYGAVPRTLNTAADQAAYNEFQRQQQQKQGQISALTSAANNNVQYGVPDVSVPQQNPWMNVMSLLAQFGGNYLGGQAGKKAA